MIPATRQTNQPENKIMQTTQTPAIEIAIEIAPLVESGKKQYTLGASHESKLAIAELCLEFDRPGSGNKTVKMSEKEALEILFKVATDKRFSTVPVMESVEIDGEKFTVQSMDTDGNLVFETKDCIQDEWETIKARDYAESVKTSKSYQLSSDLQKAMDELKKAQDAQASLMKELESLRALRS